MLTIDGARDNWFGAWPPPGAADESRRAARRGAQAALVRASAAPGTTAAALAALACVLVAGCGEGDGAQTSSPEPAVQSLTRAERQLLERSESQLAAYCSRRVSPSGKPQAPSPRERARALAAVAELVALGARKPGAEVETGVDLRLALGDLVENLEGANCDPAVIARLTEGLAGIPG